MDKKGQFFLIAALVVILIAVSLGVIYNAVKLSDEDSSVIDLSNEIGFESAQIVESSTFEGRNESEISDRILNVTNYWAKSNPDKEITVIYGNRERIFIVNSSQLDLGSLTVSTGEESGSGSETTITRVSRLIIENPGESFDVKVKKNAEPIHFDLSGTEKNFFLVLK